MRARPVVWSFGGGVQSVAIAVMVSTQRLPRPERIVMADTGREGSATWEYLNNFVRPMLASVGLEVEVIEHGFARVDLFSTKGKILLPMYTPNGGRFPAFCSDEWKKRPVRRWLRKEGYGPEKPVTMWLGISVDEVHRAKPSGRVWIENAWPLLDTPPLRRDECRALIRAEGLPQPPRSSCWMCPHRSNEGWRFLKTHSPGDWARAVALEKQMQAEDPDVFLHGSRGPLSDADLNEDQPDLFEGCEEGFCFT